MNVRSSSSFFFFNATATSDIYTLSLHDALPICSKSFCRRSNAVVRSNVAATAQMSGARSEEHTSELQSRFDLVCRLLLEKKKTTDSPTDTTLPCTPPLTRAPPSVSILSVESEAI